MATTPNRLLGHLGDSVMRLEDPPLVAGKGRYAGDMNFPNQLHMRVVRSPYAHGEITAIDTAEAEAIAYDETEPLSLECGHFLDCVATGGVPVSDAAEGLRVLTVLDAGQRSLAQGAPIIIASEAS